MRNVSLISSGPKQDYQGWARLESELAVFREQSGPELARHFASRYAAYDPSLQIARVVARLEQLLAQKPG